MFICSTIQDLPVAEVEKDEEGPRIREVIESTVPEVLKDESCDSHWGCYIEQNWTETNENQHEQKNKPRPRKEAV